MNAVAHAAELIRSGRLVAFPTETVYGLGANALDPAAVERIFAAKRRPKTSPLIVHVDSIAMAKRYAVAWPEAAEKLAQRYWPGPLTLVVKKTAEIPDIVTAGLPTVGLRMPDHTLALELIRTAGVPIAAPSANRFTELSPTEVDHVLPELADFVLDGGPSRVGIESTVLSVVDRPTLLRPGVIPLPEIEELVGPAETAGATQGAHPSPGMHARHYRPSTPLLLLAKGEGPPAGRGEVLKLTGGPREYAAALYHRLHELDEQGLDWIAVEPPPDTPDWAGVLDRLRRAASERNGR